MTQRTYHPFPATHWSLVKRAGHADSAARHDALTQLLTRYTPALASYLRVVRRMREEDAQELIQAFVADRLLAGELLRSADAARGRFRSLLLTSLTHFATSRWRTERRHTHAPTDMDQEMAATHGSPLQSVEAEWARALLRQVVDGMKAECAATDRLDIWAVFEARMLAEVYGGDVVAYEELARRLELKSPAQAANLLVTGKRMYARLLRAAVAEYEPDAARIDAEIGELHAALAGGTPSDRGAEE